MTRYATEIKTRFHLEEVYDLLIEAGASEWQSFEKTENDFMYSNYPYMGVDEVGDIVLVTQYGADIDAYEIVSLDKLLKETKNLVQ